MTLLRSFAHILLLSNLHNLHYPKSHKNTLLEGSIDKRN